LPKEWPSLEVGGIQYRDWVLRAKATDKSVSLQLQAGGKARPIRVAFGPGRWEIKMFGAQDQAIGESTVVEGIDGAVSIENPDTKRLVATRLEP
jgi:hypothetical protein